MYLDQKSNFEELLVEYEHRSLGLADMEEQADRLSDQMANFDGERESLEDRIQQLLKEKKQLVSSMSKDIRDAHVQVNTQTKTVGQQTHLSYQYLEKEDSMQSGPRRQEQLSRLNRAGDYSDLNRDGGHAGNNQFSMPGTQAKPDNRAPHMQYSEMQVGTGQRAGGGGLVFSKPQRLPTQTPSTRPTTQGSGGRPTTQGSGRPTTQGSGRPQTQGSGGARGPGLNPAFMKQFNQAKEGFTPEPWDDEDY